MFKRVEIKVFGLELSTVVIPIYARGLQGRKIHLGGDM